MSVILHSINTTHSSDITKAWATVSSKALKLFDEVTFEEQSYWWFGCRWQNFPPVELSNSTTTEWYSGKMVPEFRGCLKVLSGRWQLRGISHQRSSLLYADWRFQIPPGDIMVHGRFECTGEDYALRNVVRARSEVEGWWCLEKNNISTTPPNGQRF